MFDVQEPTDHRAQAASAVAPAFYRIADVVRLTALSRATIYRGLSVISCLGHNMTLRSVYASQTKNRAGSVAVDIA